MHRLIGANEKPPARYPDTRHDPHSVMSLCAAVLLPQAATLNLNDTEEQL
jgi:hypothetical protein